jgi:inhibitor of KinA sporulation pathway (predicted exonuclease)
VRLAALGTFLCIDLEATCWAKGEKQRRMEIVEIGAVLYRPGEGIVGERQQFVRPRENPVLSDFCRELTGITQTQVDRGLPYPEALAAVLAFAGPEPAFCSWGDFDRRQFEKDGALHEVDYPFPLHLNLKRLYAHRTGKGLLTLDAAVADCGLAFQGRHHSGIDDARNVAGILDWMIRQEA